MAVRSAPTLLLLLNLTGALAGCAAGAAMGGGPATGAAVGTGPATGAAVGTGPAARAITPAGGAAGASSPSLAGSGALAVPEGATAAGPPPAAARAPETEGKAATNDAPRVMVTLAPAPPSVWNEITAELERTYRLRTVVAWSMQSLGERCIVF